MQDLGALNPALSLYKWIAHKFMLTKIFYIIPYYKDKSILKSTFGYNVLNLIHKWDAKHAIQRTKD